MKKVLIIFVSAVLLTACGQCSRIYDNSNYESITNESGELVLWSGGEIMAKFYNVDIVYSSADSDAMYFKVINGSMYELRNKSGKYIIKEGQGNTWYTSPGVLLKLED